MRAAPSRERLRVDIVMRSHLQGDQTIAAPPLLLPDRATTAKLHPGLAWLSQCARRGRPCFRRSSLKRIAWDEPALPGDRHTLRGCLQPPPRSPGALLRTRRSAPHRGLRQRPSLPDCIVHQLSFAFGRESDCFHIAYRAFNLAHPTMPPASARRIPPSLRRKR